MCVLFGEPDHQPPKPTEADMLRLLRERYSAKGGNGPRYVMAEHVRNQCGFAGVFGNGKLRTTGKLRTVDALAVDLWTSQGNAIHGHEIKVSRSDWLAELRDPDKSEAFRRYCDYWWLVVPDASIVRDDLPDGWGLMAQGRDGKLRVRVAAPRLEREPMPHEMTVAWLRAVAKKTA